MVRETRHLWVGNLPDNIREDRIREHFKRYGRVQNVKLLGRPESASGGLGANGASGICATVAFMDIKSASKAHNTEHVLDERTLTTEYYEPAAIPSTAGAPSAGSSPAGSGYSGSSSSVNSGPAPTSATRYHLSGGEDSCGATTCPIAASAAAPANWRGTNDSATEYCRRGNTPATYGRYQRNNSTAPFSTPPSNVDRTTPHSRWYASSERAAATGGESTPSTPGGGTESGRRRRNSGSASSRSDSSSPEPSDTSRASTPPTQPPLSSHHNNHRTPTSTTSHQWASTASGRPLAICVRNLPTRSTDSSLKDGLYHEYKKHGKVVWVKVVGQNAERYAVVRFKKPSDVEKALEVSQDKLFFGCKISVAPHQSGDDDAESAKPYETDIDEYHPKATRTLFIGNLEKDVTQQQLRDKFKHFGRIIEIDIKKGSGGGAGYAFCQYASISSVVEAIRAMDGEYVGGSRVKLGFGKPVATACVWVDGLTEHTEKQVLGAVSRCGAATSVCVDRAAGAALVHFEQAAAAGAAVRELRRVAAAASAAEPTLPRLCVDYASRECQDAFYEQLEKHGGSAALAGSERLSSELTGRYLPSTRHDSLRFEGTRARASSFGRSCSRTPRYSAVEHYDPVDYAADRRYRVYDEQGVSPPPDDAVPFEDRLQSVVVSPHRARRHRRDSSPEDRKRSKERLRSISVRRSRSGSGGRERHGVRRRHRRRRDGSGSRAGTPLRDELDAPPAEPRRPPRDRPPLPMCLPLPKFAAQIARAAPPVPRPAPPPAPDSPPRPPSASSSSGGEAPHEPSLEERIRSLDEKYEKWSGSRALPEAPPPDRARLRHRLLEVDINEVKPSEVVRSLLAKRSVFDEDSERLEVAARAPSPPDTPRARVLRYPFPAHPPPQSDLADPRRLRLDPLTRKVSETEYPEPRGRPRTPSADGMTREHRDRRSPSTLAEADLDTRSHDSASGTCDAESKSSLDTEEKDAGSESRRERANSSASDSVLTPKSDGLENIPMPLSKSPRDCTSDDSDKRPEVSHNLHSDENCAREVMDMILKKVENCQKIEATQVRRLRKFEYEEQNKLALEGEHKFLNLDKLKTFDSSKNPMFDLSLGIQESIEQELQNHIIESNAEKSNKEKVELNHSDDTLTSNEKDRSNSSFHEKDRNNSSSQVFRNIQFEKENIQTEKSFEKENMSSSKIKTVEVLSTANKSQHQETDKSTDDRLKNDKNDREKLRHSKSKDRHESDKEKSKSNKNDKFNEKPEKERKSKDESTVDKHNTDKADSIKSVEKSFKEKCDRDNEKSRHSDEKPRHVHHRRDSKTEKEKRKDSDDTNTKLRKEDKYKLEKAKKEFESKRDCKKESESVKSRKSSRDESVKEVSRKDSTDSTTSKTSHEIKIKDEKDLDSKEEIKPKVRLTDLFVKLEKNKDFHTKDGLVKIKQEHDKVDANCSSSDNHSTVADIKPKVEIDKQRHHSVDSPSVDSKRKERLNSCSSLPSSIGHKRRVSSQDNLDLLCDDTKKIKSEPKIPERRESKESRSGDRHKAPKFSKGHFAKIIESKTKDDKKNQVKPPEGSFGDLKDIIDDKILMSRPMKKSPKDDSYEQHAASEHNDDIHNNLNFLALFELRSSEENEKQKALRKEMKEKKRIQQLQQIQELQMQQEVELGKLKDDKKQKCDDKKRENAREKRMSMERKSREDKGDSSKRKNRKHLHSSGGESTDSDEPKKHSIFDIIDDGPTYISMYDKVKARSCKNMQKQEEEKRQEKIKAKFSQLKQSRAKREEKKRSSWDEDSDSDQDTQQKQQKSSLDSSDDDSITAQNRKRDKLQCTNIEYDENKTEDYFSTPNDEEQRNKLSRKNSRTRIMSDTSDDESSKNKCSSFMREVNKLSASDPESVPNKTDNSNNYCEDKLIKNSLLNLFGKSDSDDSKLKSNLENDKSYKSMSKSFCNDISSECESVSSNRNVDVRRKHKKKQKKHKTYSDDDNKIETSDTGALDSDIKRKKTIKQRRHSSKKDKRKEKIRDSNDTDDGRDDKIKTKRDKNSPDNISFEYGNDITANNMKRDGKMEDIFGPLSDESDKDNKHQNNKSDFSSHDYDSNICMSDMPMNSVEKDMKRKKEKKRKEKRWFRDDDNSLDVDAVGKAIEANLFTIADNTENIRTGNELKFTDGMIKDYKTNSKFDRFRRENKEKRKKKKRSREERLGRKDHHHLYHPDSLDKSDHDILETPLMDSVSNAMLLDIPLPNDIHTADDKMADCKSLSHSPSLPRLTESPPILIESSQDADVKSTISSMSNIILSGDDNSEFIDGKEIEIEHIPMPPPFENIVQDLSEVPLPAEPAPPTVTESKSDDLKCALSSDSDGSQDAVMNISDTVTNTPTNDHESETSELNDIDKSEVEVIDIPASKTAENKKPEEKPRAIISQEETEDAVAALLGESFGGKINTFSNYEETENNSTHQTDIESTTISNENIPEEDAEEMRQAVQNLNACEMEMKPDTPVSDNDLLLIDTDTEEADDPPQDTAEKLSVNTLVTSQPINNNNDQAKTTEESNVKVPTKKCEAEKSSPPQVSLDSVKLSQPETNVSSNESDVKIKLARRENVQIITSTATPVITSWTYMAPIKNQNESKAHISANVVQIRTSQPQNVIRPVVTPRPGAPYQVINQIIRPQSSNMQPPTIKIPEPHNIAYQKPQGIVISPRLTSDPRLLSPKTNTQAEGITSPRLANMTILTSTPQNVSSGMMSPTSKVQRSPGQVTVVRMQQPPLSPIQTMHAVHGARTMMSPNRPNSVLVQGAPLQFNRLPVTPVLTPISKQFSPNNTIQHSKSIGVTSPLIPQHKNFVGENRKNDHGNILGSKNENAKIILSPSTNPTVMAQNRLISMQNAVHLGNINSSVHLGSKVVLNKINPIPEKREFQISKSSEHLNHSPFVSAPIIHVAGSHNAASMPSIIQSGSKSVMCNIQESNIISKGPGSNVIHSLNSPRLMSPVSKNNVIQIDQSKLTPSVLSLATMRPTTVLTKFETSNVPTVSNAGHTNVSPILLKPIISNIRLNTKTERDNVANTPIAIDTKSVEMIEPIQIKKHESEQNIFMAKSPTPNLSSQESIAKCETDFEELLKDNTNEIKVTNNLEKKLEINVGITTLITPDLFPETQIIKVTDTNSIAKNEHGFSASERTAQEVTGLTKKDDKISANDLMKNTVSNNIFSCKSTNVVLPLNDTNVVAIKTTEIKQVESNHKSEVDSKIPNTSQKLPNHIQETFNKKPFGCKKEITFEDSLKEATNHSDQRQLRILEDNDSWSVKDLNIESVIKKVDSLCNDAIESVAPNNEISRKNKLAETTAVTVTDNLSYKQSSEQNETVIPDCNGVRGDEGINFGQVFNVSAKRGGRNVRGKKGQKGQVQTRQISKTSRGSSAKRGRGRAKIDKKIKTLVNNSASTMPGDVYDFHEDSGDESKTESRPRLILTIKSPLSGQAGVTATSTLSIAQKDQNKVTEKPKEEKNEDFICPSTNTRKSRRLQEKDVHRTVVDEVGEDGTLAQSRTAKRRPARQATGKAANNEKPIAADTRKSPRGNKRTRDRSLSDASTESGEGESRKDEATREPKVARLDERLSQAETDPSAQVHTSPAAPGAPPKVAPPVTSPHLVPHVSPVIVPTPVASSAPLPVVTSAVITTIPIPVPPIPTPITKPPKKMISEISAKLASAFEAAAQHRPEPEPIRDPSPAAPATGDAHAGDARRPMDSMPSAMMPVGATEASDARVQSPALPHRPPSASRALLTGRATPILIRGGEGEGEGEGAGVGGAATARFRALGAGGAAGCGAASLPRGAHHPPDAGKPHASAPTLHHAPLHHNHAHPHAHPHPHPHPHPQPHPHSHPHPHPGAASRITSVPAISPQGQMPLSADLVRSPPPAHQQTSPVTAGDGMYPHFSQQHYQMYQHHFRATQHESRATQSPFTRSLEAEGSEAPTPPLELRRPPTARVPRPAHSPSTADRLIMYAVGCGRSPPPAHTSGVPRVTGALPTAVPGPPHASQVPREADSLQMLLRRYPVMWQGLLALKNDSAAVQMHFVGGNPGVAGDTLARHADTGTPMLRIAQRMRLEPAQLDQVHRKMKLENEHCILLALPCGRDHMDVLLQSTNLTAGFITYLQRKQAAGIVNIAPPGHQQAMFTVHIFPSCDFANENLTRIAPDLMHRVADIAHLLIVIATV